MGGDVKVESTIGVGTTFTINLTVRCQINEDSEVTAISQAKIRKRAVQK
jgi:chemotaxis protein histidine kinase CheA